MQAGGFFSSAWDKVRVYKKEKGSTWLMFSEDESIIWAHRSGPFFLDFFVVPVRQQTSRSKSFTSSFKVSVCVSEAEADGNCLELKAVEVKLCWYESHTSRQWKYVSCRKTSRWSHVAFTACYIYLAPRGKCSDRSIWSRRLQSKLKFCSRSPWNWRSRPSISCLETRSSNQHQ